jgi:hypothetical protein
LRDRYAVGDITGALVIAEAILVEQPDNAEAERFRSSCCDALAQMYASRLGPRSGIPRRAVSTSDVKSLAIDSRAGFVLATVDGESTVEEILDVSGMSQLDTLRILYSLLQEGIIEIDEQGPHSRRLGGR